jgi:hypothetical protein
MSFFGKHMLEGFIRNMAREFLELMERFQANRAPPGTSGLHSLLEGFEKPDEVKNTLKGKEADAMKQREVLNQVVFAKHLVFTDEAAQGGMAGRVTAAQNGITPFSKG